MTSEDTGKTGRGSSLTPGGRGQGRIFPRKNGVLWISYYYPANKENRESTGGSSFQKAEKLLRRRLKECAAEELGGVHFVTPGERRQTVADLIDALENDYRIREKDSVQNLSLLKRVRADFGNYSATGLSETHLDQYITRRLKAGDAKASVNRVTQTLKQAYKNANIPAPKIRKLSEKDNVRAGFCTEQTAREVIATLPEYLQDYVLFAWLTGWRAGEIRSLAWVNVDGDVIRLRAEDAKGRKARLVPLEGELAELMERRAEARVYTDGDVEYITALVFHRGDGRRIGNFRDAWHSACIKVGVGRRVCAKCGTDLVDRFCAACKVRFTEQYVGYKGLIFHDLRRSAARNMIRAGVPQRVAMEVTGHRTSAMFDRYNVVDERDMRAALAATQSYLKRTSENKIARLGGHLADTDRFRRSAAASAKR